MPKNSHNPDSTNQALNQNNQMSDDPGDGARGQDSKTKGGEEPTNQIPEEQAQGQSTIEAFGEAGAGIAPKE